MKNSEFPARKMRELLFSFNAYFPCSFEKLLRCVTNPGANQFTRLSARNKDAVGVRKVRWPQHG
jgi:hypothetical protein